MSASASPLASLATLSALATLREARKGGFFSVTVRRDAKTRKGAPAGIEKVSILVLHNSRYSSRKPVRDGVESGDREAPALPHCVHFISDGLGGGAYIGEGKSGQRYLCAPLVNAVSTAWFFKGNEVSLDFVSPFLLADELRERASKEDLADKGQAPFITVRLENVVELNC